METTVVWPQITILIIWVLSIGISMGQHGKPRTGNNSLWLTLFGMMISAFILYSGGFFAPLLEK
jgi:LPXTG-motif cell wall-anchored protein